MIKKSKMPMLLAASVLLASTLAGFAKPVLQYDFEKEADFVAFRTAAGPNCEVLPSAEWVNSGTQALRLRPDVLGALRAIVPLPKDFTKGNISFWFYDTIFAYGPDGPPARSGWAILGNQMVNGKTKARAFEFDNGKSDPFWGVNIDGVKASTSVKRHEGWTKFDIVFEPEGTPGRSAIVYADGREAMRIPIEGYRPSSLNFKNQWGADDITVDDIVVDDDPDSFRPNAVQVISAGDEANNVALQADQKLQLNFSLDQKGARAPNGVIDIELVDLQEKSIGKMQAAVDWSLVKDGKLGVIVDQPLESKHYWVFATYREEGDKAKPCTTLGRVNVQYLADAKTTTFRNVLELNQKWDWMPATEGSVASPPTNWTGATKLANLWLSDTDRHLKQVTSAWYRREIVIPTSWSERKIQLRIEQPHHAARAFLNGQLLGDVIWPGGTLDLTGKIKPGVSAQLTLLVDSRADTALTQAVSSFLGAGTMLPEQFQPQAKGLGGDIYLSVEPQGAKIANVVITPRVKPMVLGLEFFTEALLPGKVYIIEGTLSKGGQVLKTFKTTAFKQTGANDAVRVEVPWAEAQLWDLGNPNLYDLNAALMLDGKPVDMMWPERFGFREVAFKGRLVTINGSPVNLHMPMPCHLMGNFGFASCMVRNNLNYVSSNHLNYYFRAGMDTSLLIEDHYALTDEAGFGADIGLSDVKLRKYLVNSYVTKGGNFVEDKVYWPNFVHVLRWAERRFGNRPSIFFILGGAGGGNTEMGGMVNPVKMNGSWVKNFDDRPVLKQLMEVERKAQDLVRKEAPNKPIIAQNSGNFNDSIQITHYAGFQPMQELMEWDNLWEKYGTKPYMITEQAAPFFADWTTASRLGHNSPSRLSTVAERAAITKGDAAFHRTAVDLEELTQFEKRTEIIRSRNPNDRSTSQPPLGVLYAYQRNQGASSVFRDVNYERAREQWLNWRAEGLGLLCKWNSPGMEGTEQAKAEAWAPLTGYIAGTPEKRTDKTHILRPGEDWVRQFLVLNNKREATSVECQWKATLNGKDMGAGTVKESVSAGGQLSVPIKLKMPSEKVDQSGELTVTLLENGKTVISDSMDFQVLAAARSPVLKGKVALIDPEGASADVLAKIGVKFDNLTFNADLSDYDTVIFGRKAFTYEPLVMPKPVDLWALMKEGKRVLILEQGQSVLRGRFSLRTEDVSPRSMFGRISGHPVTKGLSDSVLTNWRGAATLTDGYETARAQSMEPEASGGRMFVKWNDGEEHPRQLKWGNTHNVGTVVIQKPERGNFRTLIDTEYALNYATVLELDAGSGKMVFCQADVSGRTEADPASDRLLANLVEYVNQSPPISWKTDVAYLGGDAGLDLLDRLQVSFRKITSPAEASLGEVLILGDDISSEHLAAWKTPISSFVEKGGICLSLPRSRAEWNWLPFPVSVKEVLVDSTIIDKPSQPILAGMSNSELYFTGRVPLVALEQIPSTGFMVDTGLLAEVPFGLGKYVFCQIGPESFDVGKLFYLEAPQKNSYRVIQTLLNNLEVPMKAPNFLTPNVTSRDSAPALPPVDLVPAIWEGIKAPAGDTTVPSASDPRWKPVKVPGYVNDQRPDWNDTKSFVFWYRCRFNLEEIPHMATASKLHIGAIDDEDDIWFNGKQIGHTGRDTNMDDWLQAPRYYDIAKSLLKKGSNEIIIRVVNLEGKAGIPLGPLRLIWGNLEKPGEQISLVALANLPGINLASPSWKVLQLDDGEITHPADTDPRWKGKNLPDSKVVVQKENASAWMQRDFEIKEIPAGSRPVLIIGSVDDEDDTFINGKQIGRTGKDTNPKDYWSAQRAYPIPEGLLKVGKNRIAIKVHNFAPGTGSVEGPIEIDWLPSAEAAKLRLSVAPYLFEVDRKDDPYWWAGGW